MDPIAYKLVVSFIIATQVHGYAVADARYATMELCDAAIPAAEADVRMNFARSHHGHVDLFSECIVDIPDTDRRAT